MTQLQHVIAGQNYCRKGGREGGREEVKLKKINVHNGRQCEGLKVNGLEGAALLN